MPKVTTFTKLNKLSPLNLVAIVAHTPKGYIWVMNKMRSSWELPGGHIEPNELPEQAAIRELYEETGTINASLQPLFDFLIESNLGISKGRLYGAIIGKMGKLPNFEIKRIGFFPNVPSPLTYPNIQDYLFLKAIEQLNRIA